MKMHQFAFVQKCPAVTSTALPPPPLNVQLTLSGGKVNMLMAPKERITEISKLAINNEGEVVQRNKCSGQKNPFRGDKKRGFNEKQSSTESQG